MKKVFLCVLEHVTVKCLVFFTIFSMTPLPDTDGCDGGEKKGESSNDQDGDD